MAAAPMAGGPVSSGPMGAGPMPAGHMGSTGHIAYPCAEVQAYLMRPDRADLLPSLMPAAVTNPSLVPGHVSPVTHAMPRMPPPAISAHLV